MKRLASASALALCAALLPHAHAANNILQLHMEGQVDGFSAVTEVKGFNCSIYNPCNPTDPVSYNTTEFGGLSLGQKFTSDVSIDLDTGQALRITWTSTDGRARYGGTGSAAQLYSAPDLQGDALGFAPVLDGGPDASPLSLGPIYTLIFQPGTFGSGTTVAAADVATALADGKLKQAYGTALFDSCQMAQNYWGNACGGSLYFTLSSVTAVPEVGASPMFGLGLGMVLLAGASRRARTHLR